MAYNKHTPWAVIVRSLPLPGNCPRATTCSVKLTLTSRAKAAIIICYLPQDADSNAQSCMALTLLTHNLPYHIQILGGDLQDNWTGPNTKDANIRILPYARWKGPTSPTFNTRSRPEQATCICHLAISDPHKLAHQIGTTTTMESVFLDHNEVLGKISLPIRIPPSKPATRPPGTRRLNIQPPLLHSRWRWKSQVTVDSHSPISLAITTVTDILNNLEAITTQNHHEHGAHQLGGRESVLSLAADIQTILGDTMTLAMTMFPHKPTYLDKNQTLPYHLWPNSVKHDVLAIRRRT